MHRRWVQGRRRAWRGSREWRAAGWTGPALAACRCAAAATAAAAAAPTSERREAAVRPGAAAAAQRPAARPPHRQLLQARSAAHPVPVAAPERPAATDLEGGSAAAPRRSSRPAAQHGAQAADRPVPDACRQARPAGRAPWEAAGALAPGTAGRPLQAEPRASSWARTAVGARAGPCRSPAAGAAWCVDRPERRVGLRPRLPRLRYAPWRAGGTGCSSSGAARPGAPP
jgi:hypothetical protein